MSDVVIKWDILERKWKEDWSIEPSNVQLSIDVLVQGSVVADLIEEVKARHEIAQILIDQQPVDDPAVW